MAGEIGTAFVRIRPNTSTFKAETETGVKKALLTVGKLTAGFFALKGLGNEVKAVYDAASQHQASFAVLDKTIQNAHASTRVLGTDIQTLLEREAKLKGFTDEDLASSFTRLVSVTHDSRKAFVELQAAEDVSRARHIDVATSALALSRAYQGSTISLSRLGIIIPKVGTAEAALRAEHDRLTASGVKFTGQVAISYKAHLASAKAADAQATRLESLRIVQDRFGGSAKAFAQTAAGEFARFHVSVHLLEVELGNFLLPALTQTARSLTGWVDELRSSDGVHRAAASAAHFITSAFGDLRATVVFLAPGLRLVVGLLKDVGQFSGIGGLLTFVAAFKTVGFAIEAQTAIRARYTAFLEKARASQAGETAALAQQAPAAERSTVATTANAAAAERAAAATSVWTGSLRANAAALTAAGGRAPVTAPTALRATEVAGGVGAIETARLGEIGVKAQEASAGLSDTVKQFGDLAVAADASTSVGTRAGEKFAGASSKIKGGASAAGVALNEQSAAAVRAGETTLAAAAKERQATIAVASAIATQGAALGEQAGLFQASALAAGGEAASLERLTLAAEGAAAAQGTLVDATLAESVAAERAAAGQLPLFVGYRASSLAAGQEALALQVLTAAEGEAAVGAVSLSAALATAGDSLLAFVGGWPVVAAAALAGLAFGIYKVATADTAVEAANRRASDSLRTLAGDMHAAQVASEKYGEALRQLPSDRIAVAQAQIAVEQAKTALATSDAGRETLAYRTLVENLASAEDQLRQAERRRNDTEKTIGEQRTARFDAEKRQADDRLTQLRNERDLLQQIAKALPLTATPAGTQQGLKSAQLGIAFTAPSDAAVHQGERSAAAAHQFAAGLRDQAKATQAQDPLLARRIRDLATIIDLTNKIPPQKIVDLFYRVHGAAISTITEQRFARARAEGARGIADFVAFLDKERRALAANDPAISRRLAIAEQLVRVEGRRVPPTVIDFILRSNVKQGLRATIAELSRAHVSVRAFRSTMLSVSAAIASVDGPLARRGVLLAQYAAQVGRLPKSHETSIVLKAPNIAAAVVALAAQLKGMDGLAKREGFSSSSALANAFIHGLIARHPEIRGALAGLVQGGVAGIAKAADVAISGVAAQLKAKLATAETAVSTARQGVQDAQQTLSDARQQVVSAQQSVADAIRSGQEQIASAVASAGANLISIGGSLADSIGQFLDAQQGRLDSAGNLDPNSALAKRLRHLNELIRAGKATPEVVREADRVQAELNAQAASGAGGEKDRVKRRLADLTAEFDTGKISLAKFTHDVSALLKKEGFSYKQAGKTLGFAFVEGFKAEFQALIGQAKALKAGPRLPGLSAFGFTVDKPAETVRQVAQSVGNAVKAAETARETVLKDIKALQAKEATLQKANDKADAARAALGTGNVHLSKIQSNTKPLAELLRKIVLGQKTTDAAVASAVAHSVSAPGGTGSLSPFSLQNAAQLAPLVRTGLSAPVGSKAARKAGAELVKEFEDLGGKLGSAVERGLRKGSRRYFDLIARLLGIPLREGGRVPGFEGGGIIGGSGRGDTVPVMAAPGEAFLTSDGQSLVDQVGGPGAMDFVLANQRPHFQGGGRVGGGHLAPVELGSVARTQRDAILREARAQTGVLRRIERQAELQSGTLRDVRGAIRGRPGRASRSISAVAIEAQLSGVYDLS